METERVLAEIVIEAYQVTDEQLEKGSLFPPQSNVQAAAHITAVKSAKTDVRAWTRTRREADVG